MAQTWAPDGRHAVPVQVLSAPDPHTTPAERASVDAYFDGLLATLDGWNTTPDQPRRPGLDGDNPASELFFDPATHPGLRHWRLEHVPTAAALLPLQRPESGLLADGTPLNEAEQRIFRSSLDAVGIRSRAWVMAQLLASHRPPDRRDTAPQRWLSLACGAAVPVYEALTLLREGGICVAVDLADHDRRALALAEALAMEYGVSPGFHRLNVLAASGLTGRLEPDGYDVVDILGLFEYLSEHDSIFRYEKVVASRERRFAGAVTFLRNAYQLVRPGGLLVLGNMLDSHPQLPVTLDVVQWPHLRPRSPEQVRGIVEQAGIDPAQLRAYAADDGVYAVYVLTRT